MKFIEQSFDIDGIQIFTQRSGVGPPLLLLHGYPQNHLAWGAAARRLAQDFTVVIADLRGYGKSSKPPGDPDHQTYSKRAMARDQVEMMRRLSFERFFIAGHDRGGRVGHRMALDYPEVVLKLAVLDIVPTLTMAEKMTYSLALSYYHWFFLSQPDGLPECLIGGDPEYYLRHRAIGALSEYETFSEYVRYFRDPAMIHATCEDYRAALSIDLEHHRADRLVGKKIQAPLLVLWGARGVIAAHFDVLETWRQEADDLQGGPLDCGHYMPEDLPETIADSLRRFFSS